MRPSSDRRGAVIYMVVVVATMIGLLISIVHYQQMGVHVGLGQSKDKKQAQYLARGAQQHFMLKLKWLGAALYDATGFAMGKNPYYDFGGYLKGSEPITNTPDGDRANPIDDLGVGPLFFTGSQGATGISAMDPPTDTTPPPPPGAKVLAVDRSGETQNASAGSGLYSGPAMPPGAISGESNKDVMGFYLEHYLVDVCSDFPRVDGGRVIRIDSTTVYSDHASMGADGGADVSWRDPFTGSYFIEGFQLMGQGGGGSRSGKKYEADSVVLTTEAQIRRDMQFSLIGTAGQWKRLDSSYRLIRGQFKSRESGWPELEFGMETQAEYNQRTGDQASQRRIELVTSSYLVRRPLH
ncbi:MAG: hypothetical protein HY815_31160 [Candidatus Riflebacteria bacterium]|nr:hypothetical protein [Candidatus Riflebacteria bacterium]